MVDTFGKVMSKLMKPSDYLRSQILEGWIRYTAMSRIDTLLARLNSGEFDPEKREEAFRLQRLKEQEEKKLKKAEDKAARDRQRLQKQQEEQEEQHRREQEE